MLTIGVDEAGRGPILGPMVMAAVALRPRKAAGLTRAGVADDNAELFRSADQLGHSATFPDPYALKDIILQYTP